MTPEERWTPRADLAAKVKAAIEAALPELPVYSYEPDSEMSSTNLRALYGSCATCGAPRNAVRAEAEMFDGSKVQAIALVCTANCSHSVTDVIADARDT